MPPALVVPSPPPPAITVAQGEAHSRLALVVLAAALVLAGAGTGAYWLWANPVLQIRNPLAGKIVVYVHGLSRFDTIPPGGAWSARVKRSATDTIRWALLDNHATALDNSEGPTRTVAPVFPAFSPLMLSVSTKFDDGDYFAPIVTNGAGVRLQYYIDVDLSVNDQAQLTDGGIRDPGPSPDTLVYARLFKNSSVRAIRPDGAMATFQDLGAHVDRQSGTVRLRFGADNFTRR
jgi:hypothetical protein